MQQILAHPGGRRLLVVLNILLINRQPAPLLLTATRFWELMLGSIAAYRDLHALDASTISLPCAI